MSPKAFGIVTVAIQLCHVRSDAPSWITVEPIYYAHLLEFPDSIAPQLRDAISRIHDWRPAIKQVVSLARQIVGGPTLTVDSALIEVQEAEKKWRCGYKIGYLTDRNGQRYETHIALTSRDEPEWSSPMIGRAIAALGGWEAWAMYSGPHANRRNHFITIWRSIQDNAEQADLRELHMTWKAQAQLEAPATPAIEGEFDVVVDDNDADDPPPPPALKQLPRPSPYVQPRRPAPAARPTGLTRRHFTVNAPPGTRL